MIKDHYRGKLNKKKVYLGLTGPERERVRIHDGRVEVAGKGQATGTIADSSYLPTKNTKQKECTQNGIVLLKLQSLPSRTHFLQQGHTSFTSLNSYQLGAKYSPVRDLGGISYETTIPMGPRDLPSLGLRACFPEPGFLFSVYVNSRGQTWVLKLVQQARYWLSCRPCSVWFSIESECTVFYQLVKPGTAVHKVVQGNLYMG